MLKTAFLSQSSEFKRLCTKSGHTRSSLCNLCVLCASVVHYCSENNHRDTEDTEVAQRRSRIETFGAKPDELLGFFVAIQTCSRFALQPTTFISVADSIGVCG